MVRDRLKELRMIQGEDNEDEQFIVQITNSDPEMEQLMKNVENIKHYIERMVSFVNQMKSIHSLLLSAPTVEEKTKSSLDELNVEFKSLSKKSKEGVKIIQLECADLEKKNETNTASYRIRSTQCSMLQRSLMDAVNSYNMEQVDYREKSKERLKRQLEITGRSTTDEELDKLLENPNPEIFIQGMLTETRIAKQQLMEIEARHADILKIEKSIRELHEMFLDMATLVQQQGDVINRIESHVSSTLDYVEKASKETKQAVELQRKSRKLKIIIIIILSTLLLLILYSIFG